VRRGRSVTATDAPAPDAPVRTAAAHATDRVPIAAPSDRVADLYAGMRGQRFDSADVVAVCDGTRLVGLVTIERLLAARPEARVADVMDADPPRIAPRTEQEKVAWAAVQHSEPGLAVVDGDGRFVGLVPPQRLLGVLLAEHDEDIARLGGFLASTDRARLAITEPIHRRLWHRLPWLLVGLVGALLSAVLVGAFEAQLQQQVLIALFVPGVVYIADAVGTQTEALIIRGLSVGARVVRVALREAVTGVVLGMLLALLALPVIWGVWGLFELALAVAVAVLAASGIATLIAMALPWLFDRIGVDPAYGSGPLATVVQDLLSVLIYFVAVSWIAL
jgi:magnesium transporter